MDVTPRGERSAEAQGATLHAEKNWESPCAKTCFATARMRFSAASVYEGHDLHRLPPPGQRPRCREEDQGQPRQDQKLRPQLPKGCVAPEDFLVAVQRPGV